MEQVTALVPIEDLMALVEDYLYDKGFVKENEFIVVADFGAVSNSGFVPVELLLGDERSEQLMLALDRDGSVEEVNKDMTVIDIRTGKPYDNDNGLSDNTD